MNKLSTAEKEEYVNSKVIPLFQPMINCNTFITIFSTDCNVIFMTNKSAESISIDTHLAIGMNYHNIPESFIREIETKYDLDKNEIITSSEMIYQLQSYAINKIKSASYIDMIPYDGKFYGYLCILTPILHENGEIVALMSNSSYYPLFGLHEFISDRTHNNLMRLHISKEHSSKIKLSPRQHEILFLLSNGFTQDQIAKTLKITRGTISKTIYSQIIPKFNLTQNSMELISKAREMKFHLHIPKSLWRRYIITITNHDEPIKYRVMDDL